MNMTDFGSTLKKHNDDHQRLYSMTTYQQQYDRTANPTAEEVIDRDGKRLSSYAGYNAKPEHLKGIKMTSTLTGEIFKAGKIFQIF